MKTLSLVALLWLMALMGSAQEIAHEFGKVRVADLYQTEYELDKEAEAIVLYDQGESIFVGGAKSLFDVQFKRSTCIKILSDAGKKWAEAEIWFYAEGGIYEKVHDLEAYTYSLENGGMVKTKLELSTVYEEQKNSYWRAKKFAMPNVKAGSVIEYRYTITSPYKFNLRDWDFQWQIPVLQSNYTVKLIPLYQYTWLLQGADKFDYYKTYEEKGVGRQIGSPGAYGSNTYNDMVYEFGMENVPAFADESFISSINDYIIKVDFQLSRLYPSNGAAPINILSTWPKLIKELLKSPDVGRYAEKSEKFAKTELPAATLALPAGNEKFNAIMDHVKSNYSWSGQNAKYAHNGPKALTKAKQGNSAEVNLFTVGLLNGSGIEAYPVLISNRNHGKIKYDYPYLSFFNNIVIMAKVGDKWVLTDATERFCQNDRIAERCINDKGLVLKKDVVQWVELRSHTPSKTITNMAVKLKDDGMLENRFNLRATEYDALRYRNTYGADAEEIQKQESTQGYEVDKASIKVSNAQDPNKQYVLNYTAEIKPKQIEGKLHVSPLANTVMDTNPLKQKERSYPVDFTYTKNRSYSSSVKIPAGYKVEKLPSDRQVTDDLYYMDYKVVKNDDAVMVSFTYGFNAASFSATNYGKLKAFLSLVATKGNEQIVFAK